MLLVKWIIIVCAVLNYGFMTYDGLRGITLGDYVRPQAGEYAGQLGPWSKAVATIGIDPESKLMKYIFIAIVIGGLFITVSFALDQAWAWKGMLAMAFGTLWYLIPGTIFSVVQIALLLWFKRLQ